MGIAVIYRNWHRVLEVREFDKIEDAEWYAKSMAKMFGYAKVIKYGTVKEYDREGMKEE